MRHDSNMLQGFDVFFFSILLLLLQLFFWMLEIYLNYQYFSCFICILYRQLPFTVCTLPFCYCATLPICIVMYCCVDCSMVAAVKSRTKKCYRSDLNRIGGHGTDRITDNVCRSDTQSIPCDLATEIACLPRIKLTRESNVVLDWSHAFKRFGFESGM